MQLGVQYEGKVTSSEGTAWSILRDRCKASFKYKGSLKASSKGSLRVPLRVQGLGFRV